MALALLGAGACSDDDSSATTGASSDTTDGPSDGTAAVTATSTGPGGSGDSGGDTSASATSTGSGSGTTSGGEVMLCNGWEEGANAPWLELYGSNPTPMQSGETLAIGCGGQGSWMFALYPHMGGWSPTTGTITFVVDVQVDGFTGPTGQFFLAPQYPYDIECSSGDTFDGGIGGFSHDCIAVLPPDDYLDDLSVLDGATATIHVEMLDDGGESLVSVDLTDMTLSAPLRQVSQDCFF